MLYRIGETAPLSIGPNIGFFAPYLWAKFHSTLQPEAQCGRDGETWRRTIIAALGLHNAHADSLSVVLQWFCFPTAEP